MERAVAVKKLAKMLGKKFGYRVDNAAPSKEEREAARIALTPAMAERKDLAHRMDERRNALLAADAEYQSLAAAYSAVRKSVDELSWKVRHYKITVGTSDSIFFSVKAEGDSWEEIFSKLTEKEHA